jgi:hypothetical protein
MALFVMAEVDASLRSVQHDNASAKRMVQVIGDFTHF